MTVQQIAWLSGNVYPAWISAVIGEMFGQPPSGAAYFGNDAIERGRRSQREFDNREIDPVRQQALAKNEKLSWSFICHGPIDGRVEGKVKKESRQP